MKRACFTKRNRACELNEVKHDSNKITNMRVPSFLKNKILYYENTN
jgi:hypothetical protein